MNRFELESNVTTPHKLLAALQIQINIGGRINIPPFQFVAFNQLDYVCKGCAVYSLDLMSEPEYWKETIDVYTKEIQNQEMHGVNQMEGWIVTLVQSLPILCSSRQ